MQLDISRPYLTLSYSARQCSIDAQVLRLRDFKIEPREVADVFEGWNANYDDQQVVISKFGIDFTTHDLCTLMPRTWLNDEVINFYLQMLMERSLRSSLLPKIHVFSTFFYKKLQNHGSNLATRSARRQSSPLTDGRELLFFPIHLGQHWCLAVVDFYRKSILYYDSLIGRNRECLNTICDWISAEYLDKFKRPFNFDNWTIDFCHDIPRQKNGYDCGIFVLVLADHLSRRVLLEYSQETMPFWRKLIAMEIKCGRLFNHFGL